MWRVPSASDYSRMQLNFPPINGDMASRLGDTKLTPFNGHVAPRRVCRFEDLVKSQIGRLMPQMGPSSRSYLAF